MYRRGDLGAVARALCVLDGLRGFKHGRPLADLAAELKVSEKTIRRDIGDLLDAGFDVQMVTRDGRAAARLVEQTTSHITITRRERYTLLAVRSMFDVLRHTPLWEDVESLQHKLEQRMSKEDREEHATFGDRFAYVPDGGTKIYEGKEDVLDGLMTGVLGRRVISYAYQAARGRAERGHLAAFAMLVYKQGLYVVGRRISAPHDGMAIEPGPPRVFAAERFTDAEPLRGVRFVPPADFRLADVMHGAFGIHIGDPTEEESVVVEFSTQGAAYVRSRELRRSPDPC